MITDTQLAALESAAKAWEHRPEMRCQIAMAEIYFAAGLLPRMEIPTGPRDWARAQGRDMIAPWVESCGYFEMVNAPALPGDLLGFRLGHTLHHVAILLSSGRMVHVYGVHGVLIAPCIPTPWAQRLAKIWRLK